jgi:hypothetical protein
MPSNVMKRPEDFTMEKSIVAGCPGPGCGLKFCYRQTISLPTTSQRIYTFYGTISGL